MGVFFLKFSIAPARSSAKGDFVVSAQRPFHLGANCFVVVNEK